MSIEDDIARAKLQQRDQHDEMIDMLFRPMTRFPAYSPGDQVIVPPTSGALDPVYRQGGHGVVAWVREVDGEEFVYVAMPGAMDAPQPFRVDELQRVPTV